MSQKSLAARVSAVQVALTLFALLVVICGTFLAVTAILDRKRDEALNETARRSVELAQRLGVYAQDADWMERELEEIRPSDIRVELQDPTGFALASSGPGAQLEKEAPGCRDRGRLRVCAQKAGLFTVVAVLDRTPDLQHRNNLMVSLLAVTVIAAAVVSAVSRSVARRALAPLTELTSHIATIEPGTGTRLPPVGEFAELELLRNRFDDLMKRVDEALARERRLTAQASHELRTPLGVARAEIEALNESRDAEGQRARALAAMDRLTELVEALLWFARANERLDGDHMETVNVADILREEVTGRTSLEPGTPIACELPEEALVRGDERLLARVAANLLDNAVKHRRGEPVRIVCCRNGENTEVRFSNRGAPPLDLADRLFEPFYRDPRQSADVPGFGLGLPLARAVARAHGGDVVLAVEDPAVTTFVLTLPLVDWHEGEPVPHLADV